MESEFTARGYTEPLPLSLDELVHRFAYVVSLPNVQKVEVDTKELKVVRMVREGEAVIPSNIPDKHVDVGDLIRELQKVQVPFDPNRHPYFVLDTATQMIAQNGLYVTHLVAPEGPWLAAWLGVDREVREGDRAFGIKVIYTSSELINGKIIVLGSSNPAGLLTDASFGVIIELGIDT